MGFKKTEINTGAKEIVVIVSYQNMENYVSNGKLYLFYNEKLQK
jgi:hypothetical protein